MQNWIKQGLIYTPSNKLKESAKIKNYAAVPFGYEIEKGIFRIFFSARNQVNQSIPFYFDYDFNKKVVINESNQLLNIGEIGAFDDSGIMPTSIIKKENTLYLYYIGWNLGVTVPFRNSIGLATSIDNGKSFNKLFEGPIIDRINIEPHFVASNCVVLINGEYVMYYLSCIGWYTLNGKIMHKYHIKWATSDNLIDWKRNNNVAIEFQYSNEYAISVPRVEFENGIYKMWYSYRGGLHSEKYRIGYAESVDAFNWVRKDELVNLDVTKNSWDSEMVCYPFIFNLNNKKMMLYNGNNYGETGIGLAILNN
jgi:hypothetical protein